MKLLGLLFIGSGLLWAWDEMFCNFRNLRWIRTNWTRVVINTLGVAFHLGLGIWLLIRHG